jgi:hypothetical protein
MPTPNFPTFTRIFIGFYNKNAFGKYTSPLLHVTITGDSQGTRTLLSWLRR